MTGLRAALAALAVCFAVVTTALAQDTADDSRATSFQAVQGAQREDVPGGPLLIGAYGVVLVLLVGYVARLGAMHARTSGELDRLTRALEARRKG